MKTQYIRQETGKSFCPGCYGDVELIVRANGSGAIFYVCWKCKRIFEAGRGEILKEGKRTDVDLERKPFREVVRSERTYLPKQCAFGRPYASRVELFMECGHSKFQKGGISIPKRARCRGCVWAT